MLVLDGPQAVHERVGTVLGTSDWIEVSQQQVDTFAELTGDHQWIHVDVDRARGGPFGGTVVHGYFTLGLIARLQQSTIEFRGFRHGLNYGLDRVRFPAPMPVGGRLRLTVSMDGVDDLTDPAGDAVQIALGNVFEREGGEKPVCVARSLIRFYS